MSSSFVAYVDESGDEGFKFLPRDKGSTRWFVLSALVIRKENDIQVVRMAEKARELLRKGPQKALHFRDLRHEQRVPLCRLIGNAPIRTVSILIHKPCIAEPEHFQQHPYSLYRWASRLLIERVSWLCRDNMTPGKGDGTVEMVFSNRSAMSYDDLRSYLRGLQGSPGDSPTSIDWDVIQVERIRPVNHDEMAGLQLADAVASGIFCAVHRNPYGEVEDRYLRLMAPTVYRHDGRTEGYGLKFWCSQAAEVQRILVAAQAGQASA